MVQLNWHKKMDNKLFCTYEHTGWTEHVCLLVLEARMQKWHMAIMYIHCVFEINLHKIFICMYSEYKMFSIDNKFKLMDWFYFSYNVTDVFLAKSVARIFIVFWEISNRLVAIYCICFNFIALAWQLRGFQFVNTSSNIKSNRVFS